MLQCTLQVVEAVFLLFAALIAPNAVQMDPAIWVIWAARKKYTQTKIISSGE